MYKRVVNVFGIDKLLSLSFSFMLLFDLLKVKLLFSLKF